MFSHSRPTCFDPRYYKTDKSIVNFSDYRKMPKSNSFIFDAEQKFFRWYKCGLAAFLTGVWIYGLLDQLQNPIDGRFYTGWCCSFKAYSK